MSSTAPEAPAPDVQVIRDAEGRPLFAVLPWDAFERLAPEEAEDVLAEALGARIMAERAADSATGQDVAHLSHDEVKRLHAGESPIRVYRERHGWTQAQLADRIGINRVYLSQVESGARNGGLKLRRKLAETFGVDLDDLEPWPTEEATDRSAAE